jgi:formylglycine-generating enzyme required for sulfatase activity
MRRLLVIPILLGLWPGAAPAAPHQPAVVPVAAGPFVMGSDDAEREAAYDLDEAAYGHNATRQQGWYNREMSRRVVTTGNYGIMQRPVTNDLYARFVLATSRPAPAIDSAAWERQGLIHPYRLVERYLWREGRPPPRRGDHPVVLVSHADAKAFATWLSAETGSEWRLPTEAEWEKAARGTNGRRFPWGDEFDPLRLNSHDNGPFDTVPAGNIPAGASPFGMLDAAGQVFEWTATPAGGDRFIVKGGSWDDKGCGVCRPAARHSRPQTLKHILIGFRLVRDAGPQ